MTKPKATTPFDHVKDIYQGNSYKGDTGYAQYIINKELSKKGELIELINHIQQYTLPNKIHFRIVQEFFRHTKRPGFKAFPWIWKKKKASNKEILEVIAKYYRESISNAEDCHDILSQTNEGKEHLQWLRNVYGLENG